MVRILLICLSLLVLLTGSLAKLPKTTNREVSCIGDFNDFALPVSERSVPITEPITPMAPWVFEARISSVGGVVEITREVSARTEVWLRTFRSGLDFTEKPREFLIYDVASREIERIIAGTTTDTVWVDDLMVDSSGQVWGRVAWNPIHDYSDESFPRIARFNEKTRLFELLESAPQIEVNPDSNRAPKTDFTSMLFDEEGILWIFAESNGIYSFDTGTYQLTYHEVGEGFQFLNVVRSQNETFLIQIYEGYQLGLQNGELLEYDPQLERIVPIQLPEETWPGAFSIMFDSGSRFWYGSVGWRDIDGRWRILHSDPEAYFANVSTPLAFLSATPNLLLESSNGYLWFAKTREIDNGLAWYDPKTAIGCWFTNVATQVIEDSKQNVWLAVNGDLYRLFIGQ